MIGQAPLLGSHTKSLKSLRSWICEARFRSSKQHFFELILSLKLIQTFIGFTYRCSSNGFNLRIVPSSNAPTSAQGVPTASISTCRSSRTNVKRYIKTKLHLITPTPSRDRDHKATPQATLSTCNTNTKTSITPTRRPAQEPRLQHPPLTRPKTNNRTLHRLRHDQRPPRRMLQANKLHHPFRPREPKSTRPAKQPRRRSRRRQRMVVHAPIPRWTGLRMHVRELGAGHVLVHVRLDGAVAGFSGAARAHLAAAVTRSLFLCRGGSDGGVA